MATVIVKLTLGVPDDPMVVPRAMITDATGALLGFWDVTEPWIARRFEGANTAYFEAATIGDSIQLIRAVFDRWREQLE